jgi:uncharacterized protein with PIN domain
MRMSEIWDERKKAQEEEYFRRKEQEAIEKMRAKRAADEAAAAALRCPRCQGTLAEITHEGVQIDRCTQCNGIWLDAGELERLTEREEGGFFSRLFGGGSKE